MSAVNATEAQAERAITILKRAIDAAENGNQAGENFVVAAAVGPELLEALTDAGNVIASLSRQFGHAGCTCTFPDSDCCGFARSHAAMLKIDAALARACPTPLPSGSIER